MSTDPAVRPPHIPAFDALRGLAMLLGVVLHAAVSYMPHRMPNLLWAVHDSATSPVLDWVFWAIHSFRMPGRETRRLDGRARSGAIAFVGLGQV
jgi:hypothetical protein